MSFEEGQILTEKGKANLRSLVLVALRRAKAKPGEAIFVSKDWVNTQIICVSKKGAFEYELRVPDDQGVTFLIHDHSEEEVAINHIMMYVIYELAECSVDKRRAFEEDIKI